MENKTEFKKGDTVVVCLNCMGSLKIETTTIKNITSKGKITTESSHTFNSDGVYTSKEKFRTIFGYMLPYNNEGKNVINGKVCINNISKITKNLQTYPNKIYVNIYNNKNCDTEKLLNIKNKLDEIAKELECMANGE